MISEADVTTVVRIPIQILEHEIREKYAISLDLIGTIIEGEDVILRFGSRGSGESLKKRANVEIRSKNHEVEWIGGERENPIGAALATERKRRGSRRNRMRTRGWNIVTKMTNSRGQTVTIYEPFVDALRGKKLNHREQESVIAKILRDNGNRPGRVSVDYYLSNTLEYLAKEGT